MSVSAESALCDVAFAFAPRRTARTTCFFLREIFLWTTLFTLFLFALLAGRRLGTRLFAVLFAFFFLCATDFAMRKYKDKRYKRETSGLLPESGKTSGEVCTYSLRTFNRSRISCGFDSS